MAIFPSSVAAHGAQGTPVIPNDSAQTGNQQSTPIPVSITSPPRVAASAHEIPLGVKVPGARSAPDGEGRPQELSRRDSLKRREALLKGKEGSRRRQRWENDRLLSNPYAQPPLPSDWEVHPTYPVRVVPYYLAPLWDAELAARSAAKKAQSKASARSSDGNQSDRKVPKELREKLKKAKGAKGLLQDLEEEVRIFVQTWEEKQKAAAEALTEPDSDEDDEIVFVGRDGQMSDEKPSRESAERLEREKLILESLEDDSGARFGRWLVHSIGSYYGLRTWSVTVGDPARREAYVGIQPSRLKSGRRRSSDVGPLPSPLWCLV